MRISVGASHEAYDWFTVTGLSGALRKILSVTMYDEFPSLAVFDVSYTNIGKSQTILLKLKGAREEREKRISSLEQIQSVLIEVLADDKTIEKKDKTANEPVQFLTAKGGRLPYEIIINQVKKDQIVGYLATPKPNPFPAQ